MNEYQCAHCKVMSPLPVETWLDAGTTLRCMRCNQESVISIETVEAYAARHANMLPQTLTVNWPDLHYDENTCFHQHPAGPPGRVIMTHPASEPCPLRESVEKKP